MDVISIVHGLGLEIARGLVFTESFYWDMNEATRAWSEALLRAGGADVWHGAGRDLFLGHALSEVDAGGRDHRGPRGCGADARLAADDFFAKGRVREDGRLLHDFFSAEVKAPSESTAPWDYHKIRRIIPAQEAAQLLAQSKCALVRL